jgi:hypothetical protein
MAGRFVIALFVAIALVAWVLYQLLIRKKTGAEINEEVMFIAFFIAIWIALGIVLW